MASLVRILAVIALLGGAIQLGWLQAGSRFVSSVLGLPVVDRGGTLDGMALLRGLAGLVQALPDSWYSLALMTGGIAALILLVSLLKALVRAAHRLSGRVHDAAI
jgi:uncharacterized membrane protein